MILRAEDIAAGTGGRLVHGGPPGTIQTDSRRLAPGQWFLALSGERHDGHDFLPHAAAAGCAGAIARAVPPGWAAGFIQVEDPLRALQSLANWVRRGFTGPVVAITGSAGKTTTRAMAALALGLDEPGGPRIHVTQGNLNNHIGVPLTILDAPVDADAWVLEMGMNHLGEIHRLQEIAEPTVRLITNIGAAHVEGCGSIEGVAQAKGELFAGARPGDLCLINQDDPRVRALPLPEGVVPLRYGSIDDPEHPLDLRLTDAVIDPATFSTRFRVETPGGEVLLGQIHSPGLHLAHNACAAIAVGLALRVPIERMATRLARYEPVGMRLRLEEGPHGLRFINDAYNANPVSMEATLSTLAAIHGPRRIALLGDMLELGRDEERAHQDVLGQALRAVSAGALHLVGLCGPRFRAAAEALGAADAVLLDEDAEALGRRVAPLLQPGDIVLAKGSRGLAMERALQSIAASLSPPPGAPPSP